jgi:hypothetical protein
MRITPIQTTLAATLALAIAGPAAAHHSFAMFDATKTITLDGTVAEIQLTNPHSWLEVVVPTNGVMKHYSLEMNNYVGLRRTGWRPKTVQAGDKVTVVMHPMRDGTAAGQLMTVKTPDGKTWFANGGIGRGPAAGAGAPAG